MLSQLGNQMLKLWQRLYHFFGNTLPSLWQHWRHDAWYHSEHLPVSESDLEQFLTKAGTSFRLCKRSLIVSCFIDSTSQGQVGLHYQVQAAGIGGSLLLTFRIKWIEQLLHQHSSRILFFVYLNLASVYSDTSGFMHGSSKHLMERYPVLCQADYQPWLYRPLKLGSKLIRNGRKYLNEHSHLLAPCEQHRLRRLLILSWPCLASELQNILPPPFHIYDVNHRNHPQPVIYGLIAVQAGCLASQTELSSYQKGHETELSIDLYTQVHCVTNTGQLTGFMPLWKSKTLIHKNLLKYSGLRQFTSSLNFFQDRIRFSLGNQNRYLLAQASYKPKRFLQRQDFLPDIIAPGFASLQMDAETMQIAFQQYELTYPVNRLYLLQPETLQDKQLDKYFSTELGCNLNGGASRAWLLSYMDMQIKSRETIELSECQYRPDPASAGFTIGTL